ncbi:MAG: VWA domain-containing protein, partial [Thiothrix sp.]|nr:VWA domain-containing protein [Thiothrix sp.]
MADLHFLFPHWLWLLLLIPLLWLFYWLRGRDNSGWDTLVDPALAPFVLSGRARKRRLPAFVLASLLTLLAVLSMAGPAWEKRETPTFRLQQSVVVGLDLSISMLAQDVAPNRMDRARFKLLDLLKLRRDGQTGLVVFAGDAFVVAPLTDDTRTIAAQVQNLGPDIMPVQGSRLELAISKAVELLQQAKSPQGGILLVTDGVSDAGRARLAAADALKAGYTVSILALGTGKGAPIPLANGSFLMDAGGRTVMPGLDEAALRSIASDGGGLYRQAQIGDADLQQLESFWTSALDGAELVSGQERQFDQWFNEGVWLALLLVPFMALLFRRGWLA